MGTVLMILAFAIIGGFLFWLRGQAANERALAIVEDTVTADTSDDGVRVVTGEEIQLDATPFEGQEIRLASFDIASLLGTQGFWLEMPNGNPFLVSMSAEVMAEGVAVTPGGLATVTGVVHAMNDSTLTAWTEAGTIAENDRIVAEFATHYLEASDVLASGGSGAGN
jgi:hypothetical protein